MLRKSKLLLIIGSILLVGILFLTACSSGTDDQITIRIGAPHYGEPVLSANMAKLLLEDRTDYNIELVTNLGTTAIILDQALSEGEIDIASLLWAGGTTGTQHSEFLERGLVDPEDPKWRDLDTILDFLAENGPEILGREYVGPLGFENTYAICVTQETAAEYNLEKVSDLQGISQDLIIGMDDSYMDWPLVGYHYLLEWYDMDPFQDEVQMNIGLLYEALDHGDLDVGVLYSTDSRIDLFDLVYLEDDKGLYYPYDALFGVNTELLEKAPDVRDVLLELQYVVDISEVHKMNYAVDVEEKEPEEVAREFLQEKGLL